MRLNSIKLHIVKLIFRLFIYICRDCEENEFHIFELIQNFNYYVFIIYNFILLILSDIYIYIYIYIIKV